MFQNFPSMILAVFLLIAAPGQSWAEKRIALVIGNGAYPNIGELANPPNDARLMAATLRQLGFEVIEKINVSQKPMKKAIKAFGNRLSDAGKDAIGMFYYAGHGVQVNGENYLIPVNVEIVDEADVDIESVGMRAVLQNMAYAGNNMNIIVMDACRNNPFKRGFRSSTRGLARMEASKGTLIAYATAPGDVALDGTGNNSPYTTALTTSMLQPGVTIERMFKQVRNTVVERTNSAQVPWESSSLTGGDFYFKPGSTAAVSSTQASDQATDQGYELLFWQSVQNSSSPASFEAYLSQYPDGVFASLAKVKIDQLNSMDAKSTSDDAVGPTSIGLGKFRPGKFKPEILSATDECAQVTFNRMEASSDEINGRWEHPETRGRIKITRENKMIQVKWAGSTIISNRELVQISDKSLLIEVQLKHHFGTCSIAFKLSDVLI